MRVSLSAAEGDLLARISVDARQMVPSIATNFDSLTDTNRRTVNRLIGKGLIDKVCNLTFRINAAGIERAKSVY